MKKVLAVITMYNPQAQELHDNISAVLPQVSKLLIYDNMSSNRDEAVAVIESFDSGKIEVVLNGENEGVAGPLFESAVYAQKNGYEYILSLDQDSIVSEDFVERQYNTILSDGKIAMVGAQYVDDRLDVSIEDGGGVTDAAQMITSGSFSRTDAIIDAGNYIKEMVIDWVDFEMCRRLVSCGYRLVINKSAKMTHHLGELIKVDTPVGGVYTLNYSTFRLYRQARNMKYCWIKYPAFKNLKKSDKKHINSLRLRIFLAEKNKIAKLCAIRRGFKDAKKFYRMCEEKYGREEEK